MLTRTWQGNQSLLVQSMLRKSAQVKLIQSIVVTAVETMRSPFALGEHCVNSVPLQQIDVERILFAVYNHDREGWPRGSAALRVPSLDCLDSGRGRRGLLGISRCYRISGAGTRGEAEFHGDLLGHILWSHHLVTSGGGGGGYRLCVPFPVLGMGFRCLHR